MFAGPLLKAAADAAETQPVDLEGVGVPDSLVPTSSPEVATEKLRGKYQSSKPKAPAAMALPNETRISNDMIVDCHLMIAFWHPFLIDRLNKVFLRMTIYTYISYEYLPCTHYHVYTTCIFTDIYQYLPWSCDSLCT